jgi:hypothetical protein
MKSFTGNPTRLEVRREWGDVISSGRLCHCFSSFALSLKVRHRFACGKASQKSRRGRRKLAPARAGSRVDRGLQAQRSCAPSRLRRFSSWPNQCGRSCQPTTAIRRIRQYAVGGDHHRKARCLDGRPVNEERLLSQLRARAYKAQGGLYYWCREPMKENAPEVDPLGLPLTTVTTGREGGRDAFCRVRNLAGTASTRGSRRRRARSVPSVPPTLFH